VVRRIESIGRKIDLSAPIPCRFLQLAPFLLFKARISRTKLEVHEAQHKAGIIEGLGKWLILK